MPRRILDTNVLINHWGDASAGWRLSDITEDHARRWADELIKFQGTKGILTPIYVEYLCGAGNAHHARLSKAYLARFDVLDRGHITPDDWDEACRLAGRVPRDGLRRQMGDCLIRAICNRLKLDFFTFEKRFPY